MKGVILIETFSSNINFLVSPKTTFFDFFKIHMECWCWWIRYSMELIFGKNQSTSFTYKEMARFVLYHVIFYPVYILKDFKHTPIILHKATSLNQ